MDTVPGNQLNLGFETLAFPRYCCEVQELCVLYDGRPTSLGLLHPPLTLTCVPHVRLHLLLCYEEDTFVLFGALCWHVPVPYHGGCGTVG